MKHLVICIALLLPAGFCSLTRGQPAQQTLTRTARFADVNDPGNRLLIQNLHGGIMVEAYNGDVVELTIRDQIEGSEEEIRQARDELEYVLEREGKLMFAYLTAPFICIRRQGDRISYHADSEDRTYRFTHELTVRVPRNVQLDVSTVNRGTVSVTGPFPDIRAANVNGDVILTNIGSATRVSTVNGDINIIYATVPRSDSKYSTVNGRMEIRFPEHLSADIYFKSLHGDLYTDFDRVSRLKPVVRKENHRDGQSIAYRVDQYTPVRIGSGRDGPELSFEVLNGDVYLRKQ